MEVKGLTIKKIKELLGQREVSLSDLLNSYQKNIKKDNARRNIFLEIFDNRENIKKVEKKISRGEEAPLLGIPIALKDNILAEGRKASAGSRILEGFVSSYDSTVVEKLKEAGAILVGRTNMDEFAMGSSTENSAFGVTRNPHDEERVAGGSSGGSAAAVASDMCTVALGSDTGGSIRQPASFCGVVGLKTTYGAVSRYGLIAMASSLDQIGPIANCVSDAEAIFNIIKGRDKMDSTSYYPDKPPAVREKIRIGVPRDLIEIDGLDESVRKNFEESLGKLKDLGFEIKDISLPNAKAALAVYYIIVPAEVSSNLARFDGVKYGLKMEGGNLLEDYMLTRARGFGREARRRILIGTYVLSAGYYDSYYGKAIAARNRIRKDFDEVFDSVDLVATPTTPTPAFKIGEKANDPLQMYLADIFTVSANIAGLPAISLPSGFSSVSGKDLPLGLQFIGRPYEENTLFKAGKRFTGEV